MNTSPLYFRLPLFRSSASLTIPVFSPLPHSFSPSLLSLALFAWSTDRIPPFTIHPSSMQQPTRNWLSIQFLLLVASFLCVNPISRMFPAYRTLARHRTAFCKISNQMSRRLWHEEQKERNCNLMTFMCQVAIITFFLILFLILFLFHNLFLIKNKCEVLSISNCNFYSLHLYELNDSTYINFVFVFYVGLR